LLDELNSLRAEVLPGAWCQETANKELIERLRIGEAKIPSYEVTWVQNMRSHFKEGMFSRRVFPEWNDIFLEHVDILLAAVSEAADALTAADARIEQLATFDKNWKTFTEAFYRVAGEGRDQMKHDLREAEAALVAANIRIQELEAENKK